MVITIQAQYFRAEFMLETDKLMIAINDRIKSRKSQNVGPNITLLIMRLIH